MQKRPGKRLLLSLRMITEELEDLGWDFVASGDQDEMRFSGVSLYSGKAREDILYLIEAGQIARFPFDRCACICCEELPCTATRILCPDKTPLEVFNAVTGVFGKYRDFETKLNDIIIGDGTLDDLCRAGLDFLKNPMYIHDSAFAVLSAPVRVEGMLDFQYNANTGRYYIPIELIEEFKINREYIQTVQNRRAGIWGTNQFPYNMRSLYYNIRDGELYRARMLVNELHAPLRQSQLKLAEYIGDCICAILRRDEQTAALHRRDFEGLFVDLVSGKHVDDADLSVLFAALNWRRENEYICAMVQRQTLSTVANATSLRSTLTSAFKSVFGFVHNEQLCLLINLTVSGIDAADVRPALAHIVRDSYLFCGLSNSFSGFGYLPDACRQATVALQTAFSGRTDKWLIPFEECALDYMLSLLRTVAPSHMVISPALAKLRRFDRMKNTDYYQTLRAYLNAGQNISKAAESLYIHRTTLLYRMEKISGIIRLNLDDPNVRLYLLFSYAIWDREHAERIGGEDLKRTE